MSHSAVCVGEATVEFLGAMPRFPVGGGGRHELRAFALQGGGAAANIAVTLARFGVPTRFAGVLPEGFLGDFAAAGLEEVGIDLRFAVRRAHGVPPVSFVALEQDRHASTTFFSKGEGLELLPGELPDSLLEGASLLVVDGTSADLQKSLVQRARAKGLKTLLAVHDSSPGMLELAAECEGVIASERFTRELSPLAPQSVQQLIQLGPDVAVVTLGEDGAVVQERGAPPFRQDAHLVRAVDSTGAGDVFRGAFAYAWLQGRSVPERAVFASVAAGLSCRQYGSRAGIPEVQEVLRALPVR